MKALALAGLLLLTTGACGARLLSVVGVYDLVSYHNKPLPFDGVRSGEINLMADGTLLAYTRRAVVIGEALSITDTVPGRFGVQGWNEGCTTLLLRFKDDAYNPKEMGELCDGELAIPVHGIRFVKRR